MHYIEICESIDNAIFMHFFVCSKTRKINDKLVEKGSKMSKFLSDYFKTPEICSKAVKKSLIAIISFWSA